MHKEFEIKFCCSKDELAGLKCHSEPAPGYVIGNRYPFNTHDTYLDTEGGFLLKQGACLRCRKVNGILRVTFKSKLVQKRNQVEREEIEKEVSLRDFERFLHHGLLPEELSRLDLLIGRKFKPILEVINNRQVLEVFRNEGKKTLVAEISLDDVTFNHQGDLITFCGLEVELKESGIRRDLKALSIRLKYLFPNLKLDKEPKYQKGIRLLGLFL